MYNEDGEVEEDEQDADDELTLEEMVELAKQYPQNMDGEAWRLFICANGKKLTKKMWLNLQAAWKRIKTPRPGTIGKFLEGKSTVPYDELEENANKKPEVAAQST